MATVITTKSVKITRCTCDLCGETVETNDIDAYHIPTGWFSMSRAAMPDGRTLICDACITQVIERKGRHDVSELSKLQTLLKRTLDLWKDWIMVDARHGVSNGGRMDCIRDVEMILEGKDPTKAEE